MQFTSFQQAMEHAIVATVVSFAWEPPEAGGGTNVPEVIAYWQLGPSSKP